MAIIGEINFKNQSILITRNSDRKFFVYVNNILTQRNLNASEIVRYLLNAMHEVK